MYRYIIHNNLYIHLTYTFNFIHLKCCKKRRLQECPWIIATSRNSAHRRVRPVVKVENLAVERVESQGGEVVTVERVARAADPLASLVRVVVESLVRVVDQVRIMDQAATATTTMVDGVHIAVRRHPVTTTTVDGDHIVRVLAVKVARAAGPLASLERVAVVQSLARAVVHPLLIHGIHRIRGMMHGDTAHHQVQAAARVARAGDN